MVVQTEISACAPTSEHARRQNGKMGRATPDRAAYCEETGAPKDCMAGLGTYELPIRYPCVKEEEVELF